MSLLGGNSIVSQGACILQNGVVQNFRISDLFPPPDLFSKNTVLGRESCEDEANSVVRSSGHTGTYV